MERMGDILARTARIRARRGRLGAMTQPTQQTEPTPPALPRATPRMAAPAAGSHAAFEPAQPPTMQPARQPVQRSAARQTPAAAPRRTPIPRAAQPTPDVAHPAIPSADALDTERVLELPSQHFAPRVAPRTTPLAYAAATQTPAQASMSSAPDLTGGQKSRRPQQTQQARARLGAGSSGMLSLGEAAQGYAQALRPARAADGEGSGGAPRRSRATQQPIDPDVCPYCHGAGYVRLDVPVGDPSFGQAVACSCKERLLEERRMSDLRRMSSLDAFRDKTFDNFDAALPGVREALEVARRYADDPHGWLVLSGGYGVGKTHLAAAIAHERLASGQSVFFSIVPDLLDHLRAAFAPSSEMPYDELFDKVREAGVLVLDDLGAENATAWATEKLFQIINYRYNYRMPTVVTTNNRLLSHMDERIRSRLSDMSFVRNVSIDSVDYRERYAGRPRQTARPSAPRSPRNAYQR
ncbi:MAG TPA: ATP-binding protein [Ktedonobacterales bacterium]